MSKTLKVDVNGFWRLYHYGPMPSGSKTIGTVSRGYNTGALVLLSSGIYVQINAGCISSLNQKDVIAALS